MGVLLGVEAPGDGFAGDLAGPAGVGAVWPGGVGVAAAAGGGAGGVAQRERAGEGESQGGDLVGDFGGAAVLGGGRVGNGRKSPGRVVVGESVSEGLELVYCLV